MITEKQFRSKRAVLFMSTLCLALSAVIIISCNPDNGSKTVKKVKQDFWAEYTVNFNSGVSPTAITADTAQIANFIRSHVQAFNLAQSKNYSPVFAWTMIDSSHYKATINLVTTIDNKPVIYSLDSTTTPNCPKPPPTSIDYIIDPRCLETES